MTFNKSDCNSSYHIYLAETLLHESQHARWWWDFYGKGMTESQYRYEFKKYMKKVASELRIVDGSKYDASQYMTWVWDSLSHYCPEKIIQAAKDEWNRRLNIVNANHPWKCR